MVVRDLDGKIIGTFGVSRDIAESKHAEQELQLAKENLENRVAERISELGQANEQLQIELARRRERDYRSDLLQRFLAGTRRASPVA